jgi:hypothetical protein
MNERQLQDWYSTKVASEEEWKGFEARTIQLHERKMQILKRSYDIMETTERAAYARYAGNIDQNTKRIFAEKKKAIEEQIRQAETDAANSSALASGLGTVGGVVGGLVAGWVSGGTATAGGYAAGTVVGAGVGSFVGREVAKSQQKNRRNEEF